MYLYHNNLYISALVIWSRRLYINQLLQDDNSKSTKSETKMDRFAYQNVTQLRISQNMLSLVKYVCIVEMSSVDNGI